jgi:GT2 family glycosyltransferase
LDLSWSVISLGFVIRYVPEISVRHKSSQERRIDWASGRYYYNVRNMLYLTRKHLHDPLMLAAYTSGYLFKGLRNGLTGAAVKGIWDGLRMRYKGEDQPALNATAREYILRHEFSARGSAWQRFRQEVLLPLSHNRST